MESDLSCSKNKKMNFQCSNELKITFQVLKTTVLLQLLCFPCEIKVLLSDELEDCMRKITLKKNQSFI